jgi:hypothetical protein
MSSLACLTSLWQMHIFRLQEKNFFFPEKPGDGRQAITKEGPEAVSSQQNEQRWIPSRDRRPTSAIGR